MTPYADLTKVEVMQIHTLSRDYLIQVLGWKEAPQNHRALVRSHFALFAPRLGEVAGDRELLGKMMSAIEVFDFQFASSPQEFDGFEHILNFSKSRFSEDQADARIWNFEDLAKYLEGNEKEVSSHKKVAWKNLQEFKSEVF